MPAKRKKSGSREHAPTFRGRTFTVQRQWSGTWRRVSHAIDAYLRQRAAGKGIPFYENDLAPVYKVLKYTYANALQVETERLLDLHPKMTREKAEGLAKYNLRFWEGSKR